MKLERITSDEGINEDLDEIVLRYPDAEYSGEYITINGTDFTYISDDDFYREQERILECEKDSICGEIEEYLNNCPYRSFVSIDYQAVEDDIVTSNRAFDVEAFDTFTYGSLYYYNDVKDLYTIKEYFESYDE